MEDLYKVKYKSGSNKRIRAYKSITPRNITDESIRLKRDNEILRKQLNDLTIEYERVLIEKDDLRTMLSGSLDLTNQLEDKYNSLLKRTVSQDRMLTTSKARTTMKSTRLTRKNVVKPPPPKFKKESLPIKKRKSALVKSNK